MFALGFCSVDSFTMTTRDESRFSQAGGAYVNSESFRRFPYERQQAIRTALKQARIWADLSPEIYTLMEEAGFGPGWHKQ